MFRQWRACLRDAEEERDAIASARRDRDFLEASLTELRAVGPKVGEEEQLATRRADMMAIEKTASDIRDAAEVISGPQATLPVLAALQRRLARKAADAPSLLNPLMEALEQALDGLDLLQAAVDEAMRKVNFDGAELEATEERLFLLRGLARKHSCTVDQLPAVMARMEHALETLEAGKERLVALEARAAALRAEFATAADDLSARRKAAATRLCETVHAELPGLKLGNAEFIVRMDTQADQPTSTGIDTVEFWVRTNPGTRAGPMMKVASGGELSRFLLALKVALAERASAPTLIFDEIDTGVGGAVADAIGQRLARLAEHVQVLSVTHAPQVAARASHHFLIEKSTGGDGQTRTSLVPLDASRRQEEVARMLAGATITDEARKAAARLLDGADAA